jgi:hypothetical protein
MICVPEMVLYYNTTTGRCACKWAPGFAPSGVSARGAEATATRPSGSTLCPGMACISEQEPVMDPATGKCTCQWINGLGPPWTLPWTLTTITTSPIVTSLPPTTTSGLCTASCASGYFPVGDGTCSCTPIVISLPPTTTSGLCTASCISGYFPVGDGTCSCTPAT